MLLQGDNIYLNAFKEEDIETVLEWYQDPTFLRLYDALVAKPYTFKKVQEWIEETSHADNEFLFAIRTKEDNTLIGFIEMDGILWNQQTGWISIGIGNSAYHNNGYGKEALQLMLSFAFQECNLHRIQLTVFEYNEKAMRLYEKLGFVREGAYREFVHRDGKRYDMLLYGLLRREWEQRQI
ncbi:GNAT family N-acetyltransferase [Pontibacillus litoralis]|uniref:N-acetyltransferase domain-containing protein n=1 Tax=Pontibacillus litoralis JSM 072002 TaxID=1385512 RepID=A0A0A5G1R2_9BACI|nr:GNAT family protein [Pontibacillus litoralis]KGX85068.1 hypothetical protein N784_11270 [Pontibacillus litoralis JSM 072002]